MRHTARYLCAMIFLAACSVYTGPSAPHDVYALARLGTSHLPTSFNHDGSPPFLVADTLWLNSNQAQADQLALRRVTVVRQAFTGGNTRSEAVFPYEITDKTLVYTECPIGFYCLASLVYAPRTFQILGDSLFEVIPVGVNTPPRVYGLVRY